MSITWTRYDQWTFELGQDEFDYVMEPGFPDISYSFAAGAARTGNLGLRLSYSDRPFGWANPGTTFRCGYWFRHGNFSPISPGFVFARLMTVSPLTGATLYNEWRLDVTSNRFYRWHNNIAPSAFELGEGDYWINAPTRMLEANRWMHIGIAYQITPADWTEPAGFWGLWLDGELLLTGNSGLYEEVGLGDGVDWRTAAHFSIAGNRGNQGPFAYDIDDVYLDVGSEVVYGDLPDAIPLPIRFDLATPSDTGYSTQWEPAGTGSNHAAVAQWPHDNDTTYVYTDSDAQVDLYTCTDVVPPPAYAVSAAIVATQIRKQGPIVTPGVNLLVHDGITSAASATHAITEDNYRLKRTRFTEQPDSSAWDTASFNAMEFGIESEVGP
jgi:hypothetical protein